MTASSSVKAGRPARSSRVNPLWSKAPFVLLRFRGLFAAIALGALLLALAACGYPLFISASASELITTGIHDPVVTPWGAGMLYRTLLPLPRPGQGGDTADRIGQTFEHLTAGSPYLSRPVSSVLGPVVDVASSGHPEDPREAYLFTGDGAGSHVDILEGSAGSGALVPEPVADALRLAPGDEIVLGSPGEVVARIPVDGVFRSLYEGGNSGYWIPWNDEVAISFCSDPAKTGTCVPPPQPLILGRERFLELADALGVRNARFAWIAPLSGDLNIGEAEDASRQAALITKQMHARPLFDPCRTHFFRFCSLRTETVERSDIGLVVQQAHRRIAAVQGPARLLRIAGLVIAVVVVAGAGAFAMAARRVESTLLSARGARPRAVGGRAALEAVLPSAIGSAAGLGLAFVLVRWIGPDGAIAQRASSEAIAAGIGAGVAAVGAIALVSTISFLRQSEQSRSRFGFLAALPWELVLIVLSLLVLHRLRTGGALMVDEELDTRTPSMLLLAFPLLFLTGFVTLVARTAVLALRRGLARTHGLPPPPYLAAHRLAARPRLTLLMITAAGLCLGLFVQSQTVARSMQSTVDASAGVSVGSDVEVRIDHINTTPTDFPYPFTRVVQELEAGEFSQGRPFDLLAIDPETFERVVYWDASFADESLGALVDRLRRPATERVPILLARGSGFDTTSITIDTRTVPVEVVGVADTFPGMSSYRPLVVVAQGRLEEAFEGQASPLNHTSSSHELWIRGPTQAVLGAIPRLPFTPGLVVTAEEVKDIPYIAAVIDSFLVMNGLALLAALLVLAAILMYLQTRQRAEIVSYGLSLRMGIRSVAHLAAISLEIGAMLVVAFVAGTILAVVAARFVVPLIDPLEAIPPDPFTVVPVQAIAITVPLLLVATLAGGWFMERRARAADLGQVMRLAE